MDKKKEKKKKPQLSLSSPQATVFDIFKLIALTVWYLTSISLNNMLSLPAGGAVRFWALTLSVLACAASRKHGFQEADI